MAMSDLASTSDAASVTIAVLANDIDPDNDFLSLDGVAVGGGFGLMASVMYGSLTVSGGSVVYTPYSAVTLWVSDWFTYQISDGHEIGRASCRERKQIPATTPSFK